MNEKELFKMNYPEIKASDEMKDQLYQLEQSGKKHKKFRMKKLAVASMILVALMAVGTIGYAAGRGIIFNSAGNKMEGAYYINGEKKDVEYSLTDKDDFRMEYQNGEEGYSSTADGKKNHVYRDFSIEINVDGMKRDITHSIEIDPNTSRENQIWQVRDCLFPVGGVLDGYETEKSYLDNMKKTADAMGGVWKEGILLAIEDLKNLLQGKRISIESFDIVKEGKKETAWIYIDYTNHMPETNSKEEMMVESVAGAHGVFDVTIENSGGNIWVSEVGLHQD